MLHSVVLSSSHINQKCSHQGKTELFLRTEPLRNSSRAQESRKKWPFLHGDDPNPKIALKNTNQKDYHKNLRKRLAGTDLDDVVEAKLFPSPVKSSVVCCALPWRSQVGAKRHSVALLEPPLGEVVCAEL
jgi:hypothetical protein